MWFEAQADTRAGKQAKQATATKAVLAALAVVDSADGALPVRAPADDDGAAQACPSAATRGKLAAGCIPKLPEDVHMLLANLLNACPKCHERPAAPTSVVVVGCVNDDHEDEDDDDNFDCGRPNRDLGAGRLPAWLAQRQKQKAADARLAKVEQIPEFSRVRESRVAEAELRVQEAYMEPIRVVPVRSLCSACTAQDVTAIVDSVLGDVADSSDVDIDDDASDSDGALATREFTLARRDDELDAALGRASNIVFAAEGLDWIGPKVAESFERRKQAGQGVESRGGPQPLPVHAGIFSSLWGSVSPPIAGRSVRAKMDPHIPKAILAVAKCVRELRVVDSDIEVEGLLEPLLDPQVTYNEQLTLLSLTGTITPKKHPSHLQKRAHVVDLPYSAIKPGAIASVFPNIRSVEIRSTQDIPPWRGQALDGFCASVADVLLRARSDVGVDQPILRQLREADRVTSPLHSAPEGRIRAGILQTLHVAVHSPDIEFFEALATHIWSLRTLHVVDTKARDPNSHDDEYDIKRIDDDSIVPLATMVRLEELSLFPAPHLKGTAFATFAQCRSRLRKLSMGHTRIRYPKYGKQPEKTKAQLAAMGSMPDGPEGLTDGGCSRIAMLDHLEELHVALPYQLSDNGIKHLSKCPKLRLLSLAGGTTASGEGFVEFEHTGQLEHVVLAGVSASAVNPEIRSEPVWDLGIAALTEIPSLRHVELRHMDRISRLAVSLLEEHCRVTKS